MKNFKTGALLLALFLSLALATACGTKAQPSMTPVPSPSPSSPPTEPTPPGERYSIDPKNGRWSYSCDDYTISITRIKSVEWKLTYFLADIRIHNFDAIQSGFSGGEHPGYYPANPAYTALSYRAVYAQNGDWFYHPDNKQGICIRNGVIYYDKEQEADTLAFLPDMTIKTFRPGETSAQELLKAGVKDAISFGPMLVRDGIINSDLPKSHIYGPFTRSGFGMIAKNHFIGIVTEGLGSGDSRGITLDEFAQLFLSHGCANAYNLDGGSSAAMIFMGEMLNKHKLRDGKTYTAVPDILIIGTSPSVKEMD